MSELEEIVSAVASSKKYRTICPDTIRRIAGRELATHGQPKAAIKATKRKLHQVHGAFEGDTDFDSAYQLLRAAYQTGSETEIKAACCQILSQHSSTRERLPIVDQFYTAIFALTGQPGSILDAGCGLNPLSLPWMGLSRTVRYIALDIDAACVAFLNRYLTLVGIEPLAYCQDVLVQSPDAAADLALLLKMSPSLERQEEGATLRIIEQFQASTVAVSFAIKSLGGREKGMLDHYHRQFSAWAAEKQWSVEKIVFDTELLFVVQK